MIPSLFGIGIVFRRVQHLFPCKFAKVKDTVAFRKILFIIPVYRQTFALSYANLKGTSQCHIALLYFGIVKSLKGRLKLVDVAKLYDKNMERFANELLPRDLLTKEILKRMEIDGTEHVWEDMRVIPIEERESHFPNIISHCKENGYDPGKECIPVVPAQHYFMGGIKVNYSSKTSREALWAVGETACNGVHGKNRLASNSLLEGLVFAKRAAHDIAATKLEGKEMPSVDLSKYSDLDMLSKARKQLVLDEIERDKKNV